MVSRCTEAVPQCEGRVNFGECHCPGVRGTKSVRTPASAMTDWADIIPADKDAASAYWGNDNPPLELQAAFATHRRAVEQRIEERFWTIVDSGGLASVSSDMFAALETLARSAKRSANSDAEAELLAALLAILGPLNVCSDNPNVRDDICLPIDLTMGELRMAKAAIAKVQGAA